MSDTAENLDLPATINQQQAAHAIMNYFLANATRIPEMITGQASGS